MPKWKKIRQSLADRISKVGYNKDYIITCEDIVSAVKRLKANKNDGREGLSTNHFKNASGELFIHTGAWFSAGRSLSEYGYTYPKRQKH